MRTHRKSVAQELKDDFRRNNRHHQENMDALRQGQAIMRKVDAMFAPRLNLKYLFTAFLIFPLHDIVYAYKWIVAKIRGESHTMIERNFRALRSFYWDAIKHVARWAGFWIGMLLRWFADELGNALWASLFMMLSLIGYLVGAWLVLVMIYFLLTH